MAITIDGSTGWTYSDNIKQKFGTGDDLQIYHDGSNNYIDGVSASEDHLYIRTNVGADHSSNIYLQAKSGEDSIICRDDESVELFYNGSKKIETTSAGATVTGQLTCTSHINLGDSDELKIGAGEDMLLYHDGSNSYITNSTGQFAVQGDDLKLRSKTDLENYIVCAHNGAVDLYHNGTKKFETISTGVKVHGETLNIVNTANAGDARLFIEAGEAGTAYISLSADEGDNQSDKWKMIVPNGGPFTIEYDEGNWEKSIECNRAGNVELYYDNSVKLETTSYGVFVGGTFRADVIDMQDNKKSNWGNDDDLEIYHDGSNSYIKHDGTGTLYIQTGSSAEDVHIQGGRDVFIEVGDSDGEETAIRCIDNGAVEIYYDDAVKIGTTSFGFYSYGHIYPATTQNKDLGSSSYRWDYIFADHALDTSDRNLKNTIQATDLGLSFVNKLNPVSYKLNGKDKTHYGLIAQEVEEVITEEGKTLNDFGAIVHKEEIYSLAYNEFISPLIKAIQELSAKVEALEAG